MRRALALFVTALILAAPLGAAPEVVSERIAKARAALDRADGIAAEAELVKALREGAPRSAIAAPMGESQLIQGRTAKAREWLGSGAFAKGDEAYGWRMLGLLERREGNLVAAGRAYDRALDFTPNDPRLWVDIGRLRYVGGEHLLAIEASERALANGGDDIRALEFRAELLRDSHGWPAALPLYAQAVDIAPNDPGLLVGYAATLGEAGQARQMLAVTRKLLSVAPRNPQAWYLQAVLAARAGKVDLARAMLNRAGQRLISVPAAQLLEATLELEAGNAEVAVGLLEGLDRDQPANHRVQMLLARAYLDAGAYDALFGRFEMAVRRDDTPPYLLAIMARAHEERGDRIAAAALLDRAAAFGVIPLAGIVPSARRGDAAAQWAANPANPGAAVAHVRQLLARGEIEPAGRVAERMLQLRPGSVDALGLAGDLDLVRGNPASAIDRYLLSARVRFPDHLLLRIDEAYAQAGRAWEGQALTSRYLAGYPGSLLGARLAADYAAHSGNWGGVAGLLGNVQVRGGNRDARLLADLAHAQLKLGETDAALDVARRSWRLAPQSAAAAQAWGLALVASGKDPQLARQLVDQARALGGDNPALAKARKVLSAS